MLKRAGYTVDAVYRVEPDRILYVDEEKCARTALIEAREKDNVWLCRVVTTYDGWPA